MEEQRGSAVDKRQVARGGPARKPKLIVFYSPTSGRCRRTEANLAHVLQRRRNHQAFEVVRVDVGRRPDLAERFGIEVLPTLLVIEAGRVVGCFVSPRSTADLERDLAHWLA